MLKLNALKDYTLIDLTHPLSIDMPQWETNDGFSLNVEYDYSDCPEAVKFRTQKMQTRLGVGTHIDGPAHCIAGGMTVDELPLTSLISPCVVIHIAAKAHAHYVLSVDDIHTFEAEHGVIAAGSFVMIATGWSRWWSQADKYRNNLQFPSVSAEAAALLLARNVVGLGIDTH